MLSDLTSYSTKTCSCGSSCSANRGNSCGSVSGKNVSSGSFGGGSSGGGGDEVTSNKKHSLNHF